MKSRKGIALSVAAAVLLGGGGVTVLAAPAAIAATVVQTQTVKPNPVTNLRTTAISGDKVSFAWDKQAEVAGHYYLYDVYVKKGTSFVKINMTEGNTITFSGLAANTTYTVEVRANRVSSDYLSIVAAPSPTILTFKTGAKASTAPAPKPVVKAPVPSTKPPVTSKPTPPASSPKASDKTSTPKSSDSKNKSSKSSKDSKNSKSKSSVKTSSKKSKR